ncbi:MAG: cyclic pyranopterin monophosphate synthase MoaC [Anaerolineae bacterium]
MSAGSGSPVPTSPVLTSPVQEPRLSHLDAEGRAQMVDVTAKPATARYARAAGRILMQPATLAQIMAGSLPKGDVLAVARVAAVQGAKLTPQLIPLCHSLPLSGLDVDFQPLAPDADGRAGIEVTAEARTVAGTGVEMEAMTAVAVALLTLYDMAKGVDRAMELEGLRLLEKRGGRSGVWQRDEP